jgi:magnesium-transporting ATPase (P-type)
MDEQTSGRRGKWLLWLGVVLAAVAAVVAIVTRWRRRHPVERPPALPEVPPGLTEEEAAARWSEDQDNTVQLKPPRTRQQIWHENIYTIFNLSLVGLAFTQMLLQQWLSALLSLGTLALNVGIKVGQEMLAMRRLAEFQRSMRPKASVLREGKTRSIDPNRVVPGDVLVAGPGDQFLVDGQAVGTGRMVVDESMVTGEPGWQTKHAGDPVYAGSFCISGRGAYLAQKVGDERLIVSRLADMPALAGGWTPLEQVVRRILQILLVLVAVFAALLLAIIFRLGPGIPVDKLNHAASIIFNLAPSSLFLGIVVTYTAATADLAKLGALVHRSRSVESLAEATVICFAEVGILAGTRMEMEAVQHQQDPEPLPDSRLRQILGDYARSTSAPNLVTRILTNTFEGSQRAIREEAPFLAALGWSAITFDEPDLRGVYVLAEPPMLEGHLVAGTRQPEEEKPRSPAAVVRRLASPLRRLRKRRDKGLPSGKAPGLPSGAVEEEAPEQLAAKAAAGAESPVDDEVREPFFRRWAKRVGGTLRHARRTPEHTESHEAAAVQEAVLLFAYHPEPMPLQDAQGNVQLPEGLIPLCELRYARRLRPEAVEVVKAFAQTGVRIKVFATDEPDQIVAMIREAGLKEEDEERLLAAGSVSGRDLEQVPHPEWARTAAENSIFGHITPAQAGALVRALRQSGESVAVVGDGVTDLPALQQATLAIARQTSTQAALSVADIVMMGNSPSALPQVLHKGQRIVHGLLDVLKLNLTQVFYLALLIAAAGVLRVGFPYASAQGTPISVITLTIPSVGLSLWAARGVVNSASFGRILARFVGPASVSIALTALVVYRYFLDRTGLVAYTQLTVTYTLIYAGLLLVVFVKPPWGSRRAERDGVRKREWRMVGLALFLGIVTFFLPWSSLARKYLELYWLQPADYGIVGLAVLGWAVALSLIWWLIPPVDEARRN